MTGAHRQSRAVPAWFRMVQPLAWLLLASAALAWVGWVSWWALAVALAAPTMVGLGCLLVVRDRRMLSRHVECDCQYGFTVCDETAEAADAWGCRPVPETAQPAR